MKEYLAAGCFHNNQFITANHGKKAMTFCYKSWLDVCAQEKSCKTVTMNIYDFKVKCFTSAEEAPEDDTQL
jgi:hypothetical protein